MIGFRSMLICAGFFFRLAGPSDVFVGTDGNTMVNESVVFCSDLDAGEARLLFPPLDILKVERADGSQVFSEGTDYRVDANGVFTLPETSRIPVLTYYGTFGETGYTVCDTNGVYFYSRDENFKHDAYDVLVTYSFDTNLYSMGNCYSTNFQSKLTVPVVKLQDGKTFRTAFFGDDITGGEQASVSEKMYSRRLTSRLKDEYRYDGSGCFDGESGAVTTEWGVSNIQDVVDGDPDLAVLAFGMNDAVQGIYGAEYKSNTVSMINSLRAADPDVGVVLVAEFSPNPAWAGAYYSRRLINRNALFEIYDEYDNIAVVDVGAVSRSIADAKKFQDFSGDNVSHPNDFMHWVYADMIHEVFTLDLITDGFKRSDTTLSTNISDSVGTGWSQMIWPDGSAQVLSNRVVTGVGSKVAMVNTLGQTLSSGTNTYELSGTLSINTSQSTAWLGMIFNYQDADNFFILRYNGAGKVQVLRYINGTMTNMPLSTNLFTHVAGDTYKLNINYTGNGLYNLSIQSGSTVVWSESSFAGGTSLVDGVGGFLNNAGDTLPAFFDDFRLEVNP